MLVTLNMKYTAYQHSPHVIKVETKDRVICDTINDLETAERIATALNLIEGASKEDIQAMEIFLAMRRACK